MIFEELVLVTVVKDNVEALLRTYNSISAQDAEVDWIIVMPKFNETISNLATRWIEDGKLSRIIYDEGTGIYQAMNLAIQNVDLNKWIWFINAGDELADINTLSQVKDEIINHNYDWYYGGFLLADHRLKMIGEMKAPKVFKIQNQLFAKKFINHQSFICKSSLYNAIGGFDLKYRIAADWDAICKISILATGKRIDRSLAVFYLGGESTKFRNLGNRELFQIRLKHLSRRYIFKSILWRYYRFWRNSVVGFLEIHTPGFLNRIRLCSQYLRDSLRELH